MKYKKNLQVIAKMVQTLIVEVPASSLAPHRKKKKKKKEKKGYKQNLQYSFGLGFSFIWQRNKPKK